MFSDGLQNAVPAFFEVPNDVQNLKLETNVQEESNQFLIENKGENIIFGL